MLPAGGGPRRQREKHTAYTKPPSPTHQKLSNVIRRPRPRPEAPSLIQARQRRTSHTSQLRRSPSHADMGELVRSCPQRKKRQADMILIPSDKGRLDQEPISMGVVTMVTTHIYITSPNKRGREPQPHILPAGGGPRRSQQGRMATSTT